jgi:hypothetical protein
MAVVRVDGKVTKALLDELASLDACLSVTYATL